MQGATGNGGNGQLEAETESWNYYYIKHGKDKAGGASLAPAAVSA